MLRKINYTLLVISLVLLLFCVGLTVYYKQVDTSKTTLLRSLDQTIHLEVNQ